MTNALIHAEDGDDCKDGEDVDEKDKMIFCANVFFEGAKTGDVGKKVKTKDFLFLCKYIVGGSARTSVNIVFARHQLSAE